MTSNTHPLWFLDAKLRQRYAGLSRALATDTLTTVATVVLEGEGGGGGRRREEDGGGKNGDSNDTCRYMRKEKGL